MGLRRPRSQPRWRASASARRKPMRPHRAWPMSGPSCARRPRDPGRISGGPGMPPSAKTSAGCSHVLRRASPLFAADDVAAAQGCVRSLQRFRYGRREEPGCRRAAEQVTHPTRRTGGRAHPLRDSDTGSPVRALRRGDGVGSATLVLRTGGHRHLVMIDCHQAPPRPSKLFGPEERTDGQQ